LVSDFSPGQEAEAIFKSRYLAAGGQIAESIRVPLQSPDFAPSLQRARDASPQAIFVFVPSVQAGTFVKQFVERGLDKAGIKLIGPGDVADDELLPSMGDAMIGTTFTRPRTLQQRTELSSSNSRKSTTGGQILW
jgi:branched-chain amino acid transport system substrate-binding protein